MSLNLKKLYFNKSNFCKYHLESYTRLLFKKVKFTFYEFRDPVYEGNTIDVIEIFAKSGLGISTYFFIYYQQYRNKETAKGRFIPYLIFDYQKLKNAENIDDCFFLLNFAIVNCFVNYEEYEKYSSSLFILIKKNGINNIEKIIFQIINDIKDMCIKNEHYYRPRIILDKYSFLLDIDESFKKKLYDVIYIFIKSISFS